MTGYYRVTELSFREESESISCKIFPFTDIQFFDERKSRVLRNPAFFYELT
ncbi:Uncharacterized protein dnm_096890 [Desulfonema magnum]|uniref:Uncharacterized protein n=1 Tax=Desulfonema magnum TaxID=45655 RepID=A0A975BXK5_9BACT|nr:Uncharacterized protein dnm_096890 [Desulfonema magnum]